MKNNTQHYLNLGKNWIRRVFVPGEHNDFKPVILKAEASIVIVVLFLFAIFGAKQVSRFALSKQSFLSEVYPAIVASLTNNGRQAINPKALKPLSYNSVLEAAAIKKADDMIAKGYFAHNGPNGKQPWDWITEEGYQYEYAGENLAINFSDSLDVYQAWMNSPGHRANILNPHYTEIGVATRKTVVDGRESIVVVQMFGSPTSQYVQMRNVIASRNATSSTSTPDSLGITTPTTTASLTPSLAVLGASTQGQGVHNNRIAAILGGVATNPRVVSIVIFVFFVLIINIAVLSIGFSDFHKNHKKSIFIAMFLLIILSVVLVYFAITSPEVTLI